MKKKFSKEEKEQIIKEKRGKIKGIYAWVIIGIVALACLGLLGQYTFFDQEEAKSDSGQVSGAEVSDDTYQDSSAVNMSAEEKYQAEFRDQKRINDMRRLHGALALYYTKNESYPENLDDLVPEYIEMIPSNITPGGINYHYTPIGTRPYKFYDLAYALEIGIEGIYAGTHYVTPNGIAQP